MAVRFYTDVHFPQAITDQARLRGVDVITAIEDGMDEAQDEDVLARAHTLQRVMVTQDNRFRAMAEDWQRLGRPFSGLLFGHQRRGSVGEYVRTIEFITTASDPGDWNDKIEFIPY